MMTRAAVVLLASVLPSIAFSAEASAVAPAGCANVQTTAQRKDEDTIRRIEQGWLAAEYQGNVEFLQCLLLPDYRVIAPSENTIRTRADLLASVAKNRGKNPPLPSLETMAVINGNFALAYSLMKTTDKRGEPREIRFVDSYVFEGGVWRAYAGVDLYQPQSPH